MTTTTRVPVVVVGAGPTGVTAAIMLAQRGIECVVLDRWSEVYPLPRAVHFDDEVYRIFAGIGIAEQVAAISRPAPGMQLLDAQLRVLADFRRDGVGVHGFPQANMFDQPDLERLLRKRLGDFPAATFIGDAEVTEILHGDQQRTIVRYRELSTGAEHEIHADAVLGCDGANSLTRASIGSELEDLRFDQQWLVVDAECAHPLDVYDGVQQICDHDRAATFMMVTPGRYRWEFRLRVGEQPDDLDDDQVRQLIRPWLGDVDPTAVSIIRRAWYTFRGAVATKWSDGRVFLLGDAAHLTPPFIGQGMCAGIRDAENITWKLALVLNGLADDRLLATYEPERKPYARRVIQMAIAVGWVMTGGSAMTARARRSLLRVLSRVPGVENRVLTAVWPALRGSALTSKAGRAGGTLFPPVPGVPGGFVVVHDGHDGCGAFDPETREFFDRLGTASIALADCATPVQSAVTKAKASAVLLRPDGVVVDSADRTDLRAWRNRLAGAGIGAAT